MKPDDNASLDGGDLGVDLLRADLLGVGGHDWLHELLHLSAVLEGDALELASLLQRLEFLLILRGLDLATVGAGLRAGLEHGGLQVLRQRLEDLAREAARTDGGY